MKPLDPVAKILGMLLAGAPVPASSVSAAGRRILTPLIDAGGIQQVRSGAGNVLVCSNQRAVQAFANNRYPSGLVTTSAPDLGARTQALAQFRDTKANGGLDFELAHVRVFKDSSLTIDGAPVGAAYQTARLGCASVVLGHASVPNLTGYVAMVEGPELFLRYDWGAAGVDAVVLYGGRASDRMLAWLEASEAVRILHCPDYDPVGLHEYLRAKDRLGDRLEPLEPASLEVLFGRFSKPELLHKNASLMPRLLQSEDAYVRRVVSLMQNGGAGLEQEALLAGGDHDEA
ncbi:hypothetical protein LJR296_007527 [Cupriavidus necator]|uniref:hypothetical protein n=1 Tax=Cupriavidus necator TaxID=106590 RepID=UPI003ED13FF8